VAGETAFAIAVAFGLRGIGNIILRYGLLLQIVGGVILLAMGIRAFRSHVAEGALRLGPVPRTSLARKALSAFVLTITNPATFMGMVAIFGGLGAMLHLPSSGERPWLAVMGVAIGSSAWWLFVTSLVTHLRDRLAGSTLDKLNHWTGVGIIGFALAIFANVILRFP
jgi:arginine exporter protein ArgO